MFCLSGGLKLEAEDWWFLGPTADSLRKRIGEGAAGGLSAKIFKSVSEADFLGNRGISSTVTILSNFVI